MAKNNQIISVSFVQDIKTIIGQARTQAVRSVELPNIPDSGSFLKRNQRLGVFVKGIVIFNL